MPLLYLDCSGRLVEVENQKDPIRNIVQKSLKLIKDSRGYFAFHMQWCNCIRGDEYRRFHFAPKINQPWKELVNTKGEKNGESLVLHMPKEPHAGLLIWEGLKMYCHENAMEQAMIY